MKKAADNEGKSTRNRDGVTMESRKPLESKLMDGVTAADKRATTCQKEERGAR